MALAVDPIVRVGINLSGGQPPVIQFADKINELITASPTELGEFVDVGSVSYTSGLVLVADGDDYNSDSLSHTFLTNKGTNTHVQIDSHITNTSDPHSVTAAQASAVALSGDAMTGSLSMGTNKVTNVVDPTADQDAATKLYVDEVTGKPADISDDGTYIVYSFGGTDWFKIRKSDKQLFLGAGMDTDKSIGAVPLCTDDGTYITFKYDGANLFKVRKSDKQLFIGGGMTTDESITGDEYTANDDGSNIVFSYEGTGYFQVRKEDKQFMVGGGVNTDETI